MGRKDSAVHVSLSCLQPVKQQIGAKTSPPQSDPGFVNSTLVKEKIVPAPRSAAAQRGADMPGPIGGVNTPVSFFSNFFWKARKARLPAVTGGQPLGHLHCRTYWSLNTTGVRRCRPRRRGKLVPPRRRGYHSPAWPVRSHGRAGVQMVHPCERCEETGSPASWISVMSRRSMRARAGMPWTTAVA